MAVTHHRRHRAIVLVALLYATAVACGTVGDAATTAAPTSSTVPATVVATSAPSTTVAPSTTTTPWPASCRRIPEEIAGPNGADGEYGTSVLDRPGIVRRDIRPSIGPGGTRADGVPLQVRVRIVDTAAGCRPVVGAAVYLWSPDAYGRYSVFDPALEGETYLRGVQVTDADGFAVFDGIVPGTYPGRWPHFHFEVYPSAAAATTYRNKIATSDLAVPEDVCRAAFAAMDYGPSLRNMVNAPMADDPSFYDDSAGLQRLAVTGSVGAGYVGTVTVGV